ncbi:MAG: molybdate ABC transporter substrate-binding protein [Acidimicrobiales bacterium]|nr:molybdate ABC transporter substrate-binding protein [Acidimicrobiales bacterium]
MLAVPGSRGHNETISARDGWNRLLVGHQQRECGARSVAPRRGRRLGTALLVVLLGSAIAGCGGDGGSAVGDEPGGTLRVFAAASLTDAFTDISDAFEEAYPGVDVQLVLAGSSALREQILSGAPADVFASADRSSMAALVEAGAVSTAPAVFATNRLQIAVPAGNPGSVSSVKDLADPGLLVGICAAGVPCGDLAREALAAVGVEASVDTNEPDVRALLTKLIAGELDAGLVYVTDVMSAGDAVEAIELPPEGAVRTEYPIAATTGASNPVTAAAFVEFVLSAEGRDILTTHGFGAP